ncbi:MAG: type II toxin-antitoxin system RelE/ParE family toxin [Syntrophobacteraceae bacterium]|nr:type II toxin-antitoxin system RelE/ParE family toxin [Syntrophobacteraceae bacterium]
MPPLIWSPSALRDTQRLYRFLAQENPEAPKRAIGAIRSAVRVIARHPEIGRPAEEMEPEYREWPIPFGDGGYTVLYRHDGRGSLILAVRHQKEAGH